MIKKLDINVLDGLNTEINLLQMQQGTIDLAPISTYWIKQKMPSVIETVYISTNWPIF